MRFGAGARVRCSEWPDTTWVNNQHHSDAVIMILKPSETELVGNWKMQDGRLVADETADRIEELTKSYLRQIAVSTDVGGWETLFQDPKDGRYWERTYPRSEMHGGGPPLLRCISREEARAKYGEHIA
jgi:Immunity protein 27